MILKPIVFHGPQRAFRIHCMCFFASADRVADVQYVWLWVLPFLYIPVDRNPRLRAGMVLAIEPMVNLGAPEVRVADDGWTASAIDGRPSAHFEHVVAVTDGEPEILTMTEEELGFS